MTMGRRDKILPTMLADEAHIKISALRVGSNAQ
jgi:hypothetical protein